MYRGSHLISPVAKSPLSGDRLFPYKITHATAGADSAFVAAVRFQISRRIWGREDAAITMKCLDAVAFLDLKGVRKDSVP